MSDLLSQSEMANQLSRLMSEVNEKMNTFKSLSRDQATFANQISNSFRESSQHYEKIAASSQDITASIASFTQNLEKAIGNKDVLNYYNDYADKMEDLTEKYDATAKTAEGLSQASEEAAKAAETSSQTAAKAAKAESDSLNKQQSTNNKNLKSLNTLSATLNDVTKRHNELSQKSEEASSAMGKFAKVLKGALGFAKGVFNVVGSIFGMAANFFKTAFTLPFMVLNNIAKLGNALRQDIQVTIEQAAQDSKEFFDSFSNIGQGIRKMTSMGKGMLKTFESYNSEAVKLFGEGASGIANMIKETTESVKNMGHYSELFGQTITRNKNSLFQYTRIKRIMSLTAEQEAYYAQDAGVNLIGLNKRLTTVTLQLDETSKEFGVDMKRLSKNFNNMRKDIALYGHLSDEELMRTTARLTQMKITTEDASNVFKKFNTFEDAANSVAMLSQTFGMNLDAMDIIRANNPEDIINMFRDSMISTGRTFEDLNRFEKQIMADQTGMSQEGLKALMTLRDKGLTHQEAVDQMKDQTPEAKQLKAIKELTSSMKLLQKIMTFTSPFEAFMKGLGKNAAASGKARKAFMALSNTYQMIHDFALNLDGDSVTALAEPVILIVNVMKDILSSDAFKGGLVSLVQGFGELATTVFGITDSDKIYYEVRDSLKNISEKGKKTILGEIEKTVMVDKDLSQGTKDLWEKYKSNKKYASYSNAQKFSMYLKEVRKKAVNNSKVKKDYDHLMKSFTESYNFVSLDREIEGKKSINEATKSLTGRAKKAISENSGGFKKFFDISGQTMGAILKGAAILLASGLNVINYALDNVDTSKLFKSNGEKSLLESFFDWDAGELEEIGNVIGDSLNEVFKRGGKLFFLGEWLMEQFSGVLLEIGGVFWDVFRSVGKEIMPSFFNNSARDIAFKEESKGADAYKGVTATSMNNTDYNTTQGKSSVLKKIQNLKSQSKIAGYENIAESLKGIDKDVNEDTIDKQTDRNITILKALVQSGEAAKINSSDLSKQLSDKEIQKIREENLQKALTDLTKPGSVYYNSMIKYKTILNERAAADREKGTGTFEQANIRASYNYLLDFLDQNDNTKWQKNEYFYKLLGSNFNDLYNPDSRDKYNTSAVANSLLRTSKLWEGNSPFGLDHNKEGKFITPFMMSQIPGLKGHVNRRTLGAMHAKSIDERLYDASDDAITKVKDGFFSEMFAVKPGGAIDNLMTSLGFVSSNANEAMALASDSYGETGIKKKSGNFTKESVQSNIDKLKEIKNDILKSSEGVSTAVLDNDFLGPLMKALTQEGLLDYLMRPDIISKSTLRINGDATVAGSYQDGRPAQFANDEYPEGIMS